LALEIDSADVIWVGTNNGGLSVFDRPDWIVYTRRNSGLSCDSIPAIAEEDFGNMWIATTSGGVIVFTGELGVKERKSNAHYPCLQFRLAPNPFNHLTNIRYQVADNRQECELKIYDSTGRLVTDLSNQVSVIGHQASVKWDGTDRFNKRLCSGVYFIRCEIGEFSATQKAILVE
jgi:hypothetical protein